MMSKSTKSKVIKTLPLISTSLPQEVFDFPFPCFWLVRCYHSIPIFGCGWHRSPNNTPFNDMWQHESDVQTECSLESSLIMRLSNSILDIINSASHHVSLEPTPGTLSHLCHHYLALIVTKFLRDHREHNLDEKCFVIGKAILFSFT